MTRMKRPWNFSPGPSVLPQEVLEHAAQEMLDWQGSGMSVMEMSHRGPEFTQICDQAQEDLRTLLGLSQDFAVMFMQGGATAENAIVPMNLMGLRGQQKADYVVTGAWSQKSRAEAVRYGDVQVAATSDEVLEQDGKTWQPLTWVPPVEQWKVRADASYLHLCSNETIGGVEMFSFPSQTQMQALGAADVPLVIDASSHILSRPMDFSNVGLMYAGAQKNAGPAGVTVVIARQDLIGHALPICPAAFNYANVAREESRFNTPPTYSIYMAGLVFQWLLKKGGLAAVEKENVLKANALYGFFEQSSFYRLDVYPQNRSRMNVPFHLHDTRLDAEFLKGAQALGLTQLKGHKSVGGMRASIYNAMPLEGVMDLIEYLEWFEKTHG